MPNTCKGNYPSSRRWSHKEMEIWDQRCERCLEQALGDSELVANGVAPKWRGFLICGKNVAKQKGRKLRYKGLIVVVLGIGSLEVEFVVWLLQESKI